ncbi:hypothetical protein H8N03_24830 [Ramlibacter sp. USB13]|uniref:Uncharacterized protein n=1 Tax=Ramlibacter cellulosilyticus TaxID=2764187 RepID=A0A923MVS3_9BURK|nr:hypothetical protein [Ramlibacter cellulosilyticus]MBC5786188.1 hypothetical protein [Ramlibacter cellulosilyticus]
MASYFVATRAAGGAHAVHDRSRCPPGAFPRQDAEYLGEFLDSAQAVAVARLRYVHVAACSCCLCVRAPAVRAATVTAGSLRS